MTDIGSRTLALLGVLQSHREQSGTSLSEKLGVTQRTVRRDIDRLRDMGYTITARRGPDGGYRLEPGGELLPVLFSDDEAIAVALALQTSPTSVSGMSDASADALRSLHSLLPPALARRLESFVVESIHNPWEMSSTSFTVSSTVLATLSTAAEQRELVKFGYDSILDESEGDITAEPYRLLVWSGRWHLVAFDQHRSQWRAFRVDRIRDLRQPGWRFSRRKLPETGLVDFVLRQPDRGDTVGTWPCRGTVIMQWPADTVATWAPGGSSVEPVDDTSCRLTVVAWSWAGLLGLLLTFDADFVVEGPPRLVEECRRVRGRVDRIVFRSEAVPGK